MDETLIAFGEGIKSVEETADGYKFGAFLVVFDSPDISHYRDSFTKSTDYGFEDGDTRPILYNHGLDGTCGKATIGKARLYMKDAGVWMEGEVKKRRDYLEKHIEKIGEGLRKTINVKGIEAPMYGTSSGSTAHAVVREVRGDGHEIKQWFIGEASITPTPAEPQTACMSLKSLIELEEAEKSADERDEIKAGRTLSATNHSYLSDLLARVKGAATELEDFLAKHQDDTPEDETISGILPDGTNLQFEYGRYVSAQLAKSGV